jgi:hypothetical protein
MRPVALSTEILEERAQVFPALLGPVVVELAEDDWTIASNELFGAMQDGSRGRH